MQVTWTYTGRRIWSVVNDGESIESTAAHRIWINARAFIKGVITDKMRSGGEHRDRWIAIQRQQIKAFENVNRADQSEPFITIGRSQYFSNGPSWTLSL